MRRSEELRGLAFEQTVRGECFDRRGRAPELVAGRPDNRTGGQVLAQEVARLGEDQVGLKLLRVARVQVREVQPGLRIRDSGQRLRNGVARLVVPEREVVGLDTAYGDYD